MVLPLAESAIEVSVKHTRVYRFIFQIPPLRSEHRRLEVVQIYQVGEMSKTFRHCLSHLRAIPVDAT
jgi:hypothetical protein